MATETTSAAFLGDLRTPSGDGWNYKDRGPPLNQDSDGDPGVGGGSWGPPSITGAKVVTIIIDE